MQLILLGILIVIAPSILVVAWLIWQAEDTEKPRTSMRNR